MGDTTSGFGGFGAEGGAWDVGGFGGGADQSAGYSPVWGDQWDLPDSRNFFDRSWDYLSDGKNWSGKDGIASQLQTGLKGLAPLTAGGGGAAAGAPPGIGGGGGLSRGAGAAGLMALLTQLRQRQAQSLPPGAVMPARPQGGLLGGL